MADRDVKLIIRAKNEATKTISSVSEALANLDKAQAKVGSSATKTDDLIGRLGQEFQKLNNQVTALGALSKVAGFLDRAGAAVESLKQGVGGAEAKFAELSQAATKAAAATKALEQQASSLNERQKQQREEMEAARKATLSNAAAQKELLAARKAYNAALKVKEGTEGRDAGITNTKASLAAAEAAVAANKEAYEKLRATYAATRQEAASLDRQIRESTKSQNQLTNASSDAEASLARQRGSLEKGEQEYAQLKGIVDGAAASLGNVATKQDSLTSSISRLVPEVDRLGKTMAAMQRYSTGGGSFTDPKLASAMRQQRGEMEKTEETWRTLQAEAKRLAVEMRGVAQPTEQQVSAFRQVTAAAAAAKAEYMSQQAALHALQGTAKSTFAAFIAGVAPLRQVTAQLDDTQHKVDELAAAMQRYSTGSGGIAEAKVAASMRQQSQVVDEARRRWQTLSAEVQRLRGQMSVAGASTEQQAHHLRNVAAAANLAEKEFREAAAALRQMEAGGRGGGGGIFGAINRESRQAMSVFQRLRGEVLSLTTAYLGLYGAIAQIGGVIDSFRTVEAAQNRLGAVFRQDMGAVRNEMGWLGRQASRLGIEFGTLSDEYSKFAVAANGANFASESTRKVFLRVAEAGRVNKLSMEQMSLIFLALQQMISKGKIQSEELRRQLGDQLPGAFNIMADALGVTTQELDKMMKSGEILANETTLLKFADQLEQRFGPQLADALRSTTTQIGMFQNNLFKAQVAFANGGFIAAFTDLLKDMNRWFESEEGVKFFLSLGSAAGKFVDILRLMFDNMGLITSALQILVAVKVASWLTSIANNAIAASRNLGVLSAATTGVVTANNVAAASTAAFTGRLAAAGTSVVAFVRGLTLSKIALATTTAATTVFNTVTSATQLRLLAASAASVAYTGVLAALRAGLTLAATAARGFMAAVGGPLGVAVAIGTYFAVDVIAKWSSEVDGATEALAEHARMMDKIVGKYESAEGEVKDWGKALEDFSLDQLQANARKLRDEFEALKKEIEDALDTPGIKATVQGWGDVAEQIAKLRAAYDRGKITLDEFREKLEGIYAGTSKRQAQEFIEGLLNQTRRLQELRQATTEAEAAANRKRDADRGLSDAASSSTKTLDGMANAAKDNASALNAAAAAAADYKDALDNIKGMIPELAEEMKRLKAQDAFDTEVARINAQGGPKNAADAAIIAQGQIAVDLTGIDRSIKEAAKLIIEKENFGGKAYWDVNAFRVGFGSDTVTLDDGSIRKVTQATTTSRENALKDLSRRIGEYQTGIKKAIGLDKWTEQSEKQQAVLTSIAYNYGSLPKNIVAAIQTGNTASVSAAIRSRAGDNRGINRKRRMSEAATYESSEETDKAIRAEEKRAEAAKNAREEKEKEAAAVTQSLVDMGFENLLIEARLAGKEKEAFIAEQMSNWQKRHKAATADEIALAEQLLSLQYDLNKALSVEEQKKKDIAEADKRVNDLQTRRSALMEQRSIFESQGNSEKVNETNALIGALNTQLREAIANTVALYRAIGGEGADAAIVKLQTLDMTIASAGDGMRRVAMTAGEMQASIFSNLESGVIGAFENFAQAIASGENALKSLADAFRQFASQFLMEIAKMILKQIMFNTLQAISKAIGGGIGSIVAHAGGIVGKSVTGRRTVAPGWFAGAMRYHTGGIAGLKPNEVPAILETGEEVLTEQDARHSKNFGKGGASGPDRTKIVNMFDAASFLSEALNSTVGEETILNFVRANPGAFKAALG